MRAFLALSIHHVAPICIPKTSGSHTCAFKSIDGARAYFPYAAGPSTLGSRQLRQNAEMRGGEGVPFTLAIFTATTDEWSKSRHDLITGKSFDWQLR